MPSFNYDLTLTPNGGGQPINVTNITKFVWGANRNPGPNGHVGQRRHQLDWIHIERLVSLPVNGLAKLDDDVIKAAAAIEKKAYYTGEITVAPPDDSANIIRTHRFPQGHICDIQEIWEGDKIRQSFDICLTKHTVGDVTFEQNQEA